MYVNYLKFWLKHPLFLEYYKNYTYYSASWLKSEISTDMNEIKNKIYLTKKLIFSQVFEPTPNAAGH